MKRKREASNSVHSCDSKHDDTVGHMNPIESNIRAIGSNGRYQIISQLGEGTFGKVYLCNDRKYTTTSDKTLQNNQDKGDMVLETTTKKHIVAIKIIRNLKKYVDAAKDEAEILWNIYDTIMANHEQNVTTSHTPSKYNNFIIKLYSSFSFESYYCISFEPCYISLYELIKRNGYKGIIFPLYVHIMYQLLTAISYLHEEVHLIHADLKLENVMIVLSPELLEQYSNSDRHPNDKNSTIEWKFEHNNYSTMHYRKVIAESDYKTKIDYKMPKCYHIKIIDFGAATYDHDKHKTTIINTRQYRAPEIILFEDRKWSYSSDIWSLGCICMEMYSGELLFGVHDNLSHLVMMEQFLRNSRCQMLPHTNSNANEQIISRYNDLDENEAEIFPNDMVEKMPLKIRKKYFSYQSKTEGYYLNIQHLSTKQLNYCRDILYVQDIFPYCEQDDGDDWIEKSRKQYSNVNKRRVSTHPMSYYMNIMNFTPDSVLQEIVSSLVACDCGCKLYKQDWIDSNTVVIGSNGDLMSKTVVSSSTGDAYIDGNNVLQGNRWNDLIRMQYISIVNLILSMLVINPKQRITAKDALQQPIFKKV